MGKTLPGQPARQSGDAGAAIALLYASRGLGHELWHGSILQARAHLVARTSLIEEQLSNNSGEDLPSPPARWPQL